VWFAALALALAVVAALVWQAPSDGPRALTRADVDRVVQERIDASREEERATPPDAARAYQTVLPSLVYIATERTGADGAESGTGAGVLVSGTGAVLTALHVVEGASEIRVRFADGTQTTAEVNTERPDTDIAVLSVQQLPQVVVPAVLGGGAQVGDAVFALGHPLGLAQSLSAGVVSALDRSIRLEDDRSLEGLIQFDAAVNPGNSGGPLLDRDGQVIGIVTGLANPSQQSFFVGIGFAVPIATAGGIAGSPPQ
jgi:S1-C subfamily serine protease